MRLCFLLSVSRALRVREFALVPGPPASLDTEIRLERRDTEGAGLARAGRYVWLGSRCENFRHLKELLQNYLNRYAALIVFYVDFPRLITFMYTCVYPSNIYVKRMNPDEW